MARIGWTTRRFAEVYLANRYGGALEHHIIN